MAHMSIQLGTRGYDETRSQGFTTLMQGKTQFEWCELLSLLLVRPENQ
jgi:hypothetical protein